MSDLRIGAIGAGGFGLFALQHLTQLPGVRLTAMARTTREPALRMAERFGVRDLVEVDALVNADDVDLVYIATPPFLHHPDALAALRAGKHVICEKPLALTLAQADELVEEARARGLLLVVNLMQRYNPLSARVRDLIESRALGELLHGTFENYASDEGLPAEHWFWDRELSGGIFVEHGVHFFDLFELWLGPGTVVSAHRTLRPANGVEEQVQCVVRHENGALVSHYHGFTQPSRLDRQETRLLFERGDVRLGGWIPDRFEIDGIVDEAGARRLRELFPEARFDVTSYHQGTERKVTARHRSFEVLERVRLRGGDDTVKMHLYGDLIRALGTDQLAWIADRSHARVTTEENARRSLATAIRADELARE